MGTKETEKLIKQMRKKRKEVTKSPEAALEYLHKLGIVTKNGNLTRHYKDLCIPLDLD